MALPDCHIPLWPGVKLACKFTL